MSKKMDRDILWSWIRLDGIMDWNMIWIWARDIG